MSLLRRLFNLRGDLGSLFGNTSKQDPYNNVKVPTFQSDPTFTKAQGDLASLGSNILSGNLPSYYSNIGKQNSPAFQATVANTTGQINAASAQQAAASGTDRSGVAATAAAGNLANVLPQMNYQDFLNSQQQQMGLLGLGANITQDVAGNGLNNQSQINNFAQNDFNDQMNLITNQSNWNQNAAATQGQAQGNFLNGLFGQNVGGMIGGITGVNTGTGNTSQNGISGTLLSALGSLGQGGGANLSTQVGSFGGGASALGYSPATAAALPGLMLAGV